MLWNISKSSYYILCIFFQEKSDVISARILVYGAIIRSGLFERCVEEQQEKILETLLSLSRRKSYFVPLTFSFLLDLIQKVGLEIVYTHAFFLIK